jgi:predicted TIM-barrel enzyme
MSGTVVMKNVNVDVSISGDGVGTGLMAIDTKTGMIVINDLITSYQLHMAVSGSQQALIPMEMDVAFSVRAR